MDRFTYEKLRKAEPELALPEWHRLRRTDRHRAKRFTVDELRARRAAKLLAREPGTVDALQKYSLVDVRRPGIDDDTIAEVFYHRRHG